MRSIPHYVRFPVENIRDYEEIKCRLNGSDPERYPADWGEQVKRILASDHAVGMWLEGFFGVPRRLMGLEGLSFAYYDQPELVRAINRDHVQFVKDLSARALQDLPIEYACIWEDMAFKNGSLISPRLFRQFMTPYYEEAITFLRQRGVKKILVDCDGDVRDLVALFIEAGVDGIFPCERAAESDPVELRQRYPDFALLGGVDKRALIAGPEAIDKDLAHLEPTIASGGYIPGVDHAVPPDVPFAHYRYFCERRQAVLEKCF
jgi:uroporphyrinogen decarboxylase